MADSRFGSARRVFRVSAPFYGQALPSMESSCPVVASYGGKDWLTTEAVRLKQELESRGIPHDLNVYTQIHFRLL